MTQNKVLPGAYIVFASKARASATISDRGVAAAPFELSWGPVGEVRLIEQREFLKNCMELFGYPYSAPEMLPLREIFKHAIKCYCYRLPTSSAKEAKAETATDNLVFANAKYKGERGNDIVVQIDEIANTSPKQYNVLTLVCGSKVDEQTCEHWSELKDNGFVDFVKNVTIEETRYALTEDETVVGDDSKTYYIRTGEEGSYIYTPVPTEDLDNADIGNYYESTTAEVQYVLCFASETADVPYKQIPNAVTNMTGGDDGGDPTGTAHESFLDAIEACSFNTLCCPCSDDTTVAYYVSYTKAQREQVGAYFQLVCYKPGTSSGADYEGVIGLWNKPKNTGVNEAILTYWLTGAEAAAPINGSLTNTKYDGELDIEIDTKQSVLEDHIKKGHLVFHQSNGDIVILTDIDSLVTLSENFGSMFQRNQTIRVRDNIANDFATLFVQRYLGIVQNDESGRDSWWNEVVKYFRELQRLRAITEFDPDIVTVEEGDEKDIVVTHINGLNIVNAMERLYMTVICR